MSKFIVETGNRYGKLLVTSYAGTSESGRTRWNCMCDCGNKTIVFSTNLRTGTTRSCGCSMGWAGTKLPLGRAAFNRLYYRYKCGAIKRGLLWALTKEDFSFITQMNCYYCGVGPKQSYTAERLNGYYIHNGIDRLDNNRGYTMDNVVPCCTICNKMKGTLSVNEFKDHILRVARRREYYG